MCSSQRYAPQFEATLVRAQFLSTWLAILGHVHTSHHLSHHSPHPRLTVTSNRRCTSTAPHPSPLPTISAARCSTTPPCAASHHACTSCSSLAPALKHWTSSARPQRCGCGGLMWYVMISQDYLAPASVISRSAMRSADVDVVPQLSHIHTTHPLAARHT